MATRFLIQVFRVEGEHKTLITDMHTNQRTNDLHMLMNMYRKSPGDLVYEVTDLSTMHTETYKNFYQAEGGNQGMADSVFKATYVAEVIEVDDQLTTVTARIDVPGDKVMDYQWVEALIEALNRRPEGYQLTSLDWIL